MDSTKHIERETEYLFNADWFSDDFDPEDNEEHMDRAYKLQYEYSWEEIYPIWKGYLYKNCKTFKELVNYANLYYYYGGTDHIISDPYEFCSYFMYRYDISELWDEGGEDIENLVISVLKTCGYVSFWMERNTNIFEDEDLKYHILEWRKKDE